MFVIRGEAGTGKVHYDECLPVYRTDYKIR